MPRRAFEKTIIISDMDSTLLDSQNKISSENLRAIECFMKQGGLFTVATGRTEMALYEYMEELCVNLPAIVLNGALVFDFKKEEFIIKKELADETEMIIKALMDFFPGVGVEVLNGKKVYFASENDITEYHTQREKFSYETISIDLIPKPWYQVALAGSAELLDKIEKYIYESNILGGRLRCVRSESIFLNILSSNASKGSAIKDLVKLHKLHDYKVIGIGDSMNDKEMLEIADFGIAVENARPELKKYADYICTCNNNSALAHVINNICDFKKPVIV